jgi:hypothetical protein
MKSKLSLAFLLFLLFTVVIKAQNNDEKWTFGLSFASAMYFEQDSDKIGGTFVHQTPRVSISRYFVKNITLEASFATSVFDSQKYTTFDGVARYDFGNSYDNIVPYILLGGSLISAEQLTPTLNFGVGNTFWFAPNYGVNFQLMYKFSEDKFTTQFSHLYPSIGLVYSFKSRNMNRRLWNMKH